MFDGLYCWLTLIVLVLYFLFLVFMICFIMNVCLFGFSVYWCFRRYCYGLIV